ncbi:MAG: radical SAM protein, partial [Desulfobacterales bacterium]|nr:radical SAM protein [Desulfobacterales bacterium]
MAELKSPNLVFSDPKGKIFNHPHLRWVGRSGNRIVLPDPSEWVPLPRGSQLFSMPGRIPIGWDEENESFVPVRTLTTGRKGVDCTAVAAFLPPGYVRTLLPATHQREDAPVLPLWAYSSVGWKNGRFWATGLLIDPDPHWHPKYFENDRLLRNKVDALLKKNSQNRLLRQLSRCALEYRCFAAKNVFFKRWECPLPTSPSCNANCLGCISLQ